VKIAPLRANCYFRRVTATPPTGTTRFQHPGIHIGDFIAFTLLLLDSDFERRATAIGRT
jgi:hypothetical protein